MILKIPLALRASPFYKGRLSSLRDLKIYPNYQIPRRGSAFPFLCKRKEHVVRMDFKSLLRFAHLPFTKGDYLSLRAIKKPGTSPGF